MIKPAPANTTIRIMSYDVMDLELIEREITQLEFTNFHRDLRARAAQKGRGTLTETFSAAANDGPGFVSLAAAFEHFVKRRPKTSGLITAQLNPDQEMCYGQDIVTSLSPFAVFGFYTGQNALTFSRVINSRTVDVYASHDLAASYLGAGYLLGMFRNGFDKFDRK